MSEKEAAGFISKYYDLWRAYVKRRCRELGIYSCFEDILHDVLIESLLNIDILPLDGTYFRALIFRTLRFRTIDRWHARRTVSYADGQGENIPEKGGTSFLWDKMPEDDFARFRECSCNIRSDDFIGPVKNGYYITPRNGWVSGWVHSYSVGNRRYTYWLYSAFVGSRSKGEHPRRLKTSSSRHEAYMALMEYNKL